VTPTVVSVGAASGTSGAITPPFGTGWLADDIMIGCAESNGGSNYTPPAGWAQVTGSPITVTTLTQLTVLWRRFVAGDTAQSWGTQANHGMGRIIGVRGVKTSGNPWNATPQVSQDTAASATATWPALTTTVADCLILFIIATGRDITSTANLGALTGGTGLTNIIEQMDNWTLTGGGGGIGMVTATKAAAGTTGAPTATMGSTDAKALMTLALEPAPPTFGPPQSHPAYRILSQQLAGGA
jgi:hypothetical protein